MPGMTLTEKIIAHAAGLEQVSAGDEVWATADRVIMNDSSGPRRFDKLVAELGGPWDPRRLVIVSDHFVPAANVRHASILKQTRSWAKDAGVDAFYEYEGILHNLVLQERLVRPGMLLVGADSHTCTAGAAGAVAVPVGSTELATVIATGQIWLRVPATHRIELKGSLGPSVAIRDLTMAMLGRHSCEFALYQAIEYGGPAIEHLALEERLVLSNQGIEMGAKNAIVVPEGGVLDDEDRQSGRPISPDADAIYVSENTYDLGELEPMVAIHPSPDHVVTAASLPSTAVDMAWLGSCAGGRAADLRAAAAILRGKRARIPLLVTPATRAIYAECLGDGTVSTLVEAGATVLPPGCGACAGIHAGVQGSGDRVIATATRNFPGRMGSRQAEVYIGSAFTVAASALAGRVLDPREAWEAVA